MVADLSKVEPIKDTLILPARYTVEPAANGGWVITRHIDSATNKIPELPVGAFSNSTDLVSFLTKQHQLLEMQSGARAAA